MTEESAPRFSTWFRRWWLALLGLVAAIGGGVLWLVTELIGGAPSYGWFAYQPLARRYFTYSSSSDFAFVSSYNPLAQAVHVAGAALFIAGLVVAAAVIGYRVGRARP